MRTNAKYALAAGVIAVGAAGAGAAAVGAASSDDTEAPITGAALDKARSAALAHTGNGRVTGTEVGDEDSSYEIEVTLDLGAQVDEQLDKTFNVVETKPDHEEPGDQDDP